MKNWLQEYGWMLWLGGTIGEFTGLAPHNSWQWWAIIIPTGILISLRRSEVENEN